MALAGMEPALAAAGWIVERTFAWLGRQRRLAKDWERLAATTETWIHLAMSRLMAKRLARTAP
jgi:transposase